MTFSIEDRLRELEHEVRELRSQLGRLPTRPASPPLPFSMILCQVKGAVTGSTYTFPVDHIVLIDGVDPRVDPDDPLEELMVVDPLAADHEDDSWIYCVYKPDTGEWGVIVAKGEKGDPGDPGAPGPPGADGSVGYTAGCGISIGEGNVLAIDPIDLAGAGLIPGTGCSLDVNVGCGLVINTDAVEIDPSIFGDGLSWSGSECEVSVVLTAGCGINVSGAQVSVKASDLVGLNGGLQTSGTCGLAVKPDCGIQVGAGGVGVKNSDLVGNGLEAAGTCGLAVKAGCGINVDGSGVAVDPADIAGDGLEPAESGCALDVAVDCSLDIVGGLVKVHTEFPDDAHGLEWTDANECSIQIKKDCSLQFNGSGELGINNVVFEGDYLVWSPSSCDSKKLNVQHSYTSWITDITGFAIEGDTLVIKYARNFGYVLQQTATVFAEKRVPIKDPCAE